MCLWMGPVRAPLAPALLHGLLALQRTLRAKHTFSREWGTSCLACMVFCLLVCLFLNIPATVQLPRTWAYTSALGQCPHSTTVLVPCARVAVSGAAELTPHFPRLLQGFSVDRRALAQREKGRGLWQAILHAASELCVLYPAMLHIAFSRFNRRYFPKPNIRVVLSCSVIWIIHAMIPCCQHESGE